MLIALRREVMKILIIMMTSILTTYITDASTIAEASEAGCVELYTGKRFTGKHNVCCSPCGKCCALYEPYISHLNSAKSGGFTQRSIFYQSSNCRSGKGVTVDDAGWRDMSKLPAYRSVVTACIP